MNESEPLMTHRNSEILSKPEGPHAPGQAHQVPDYRVGGRRCKGGMSQSQAPMRNTGTCRPAVKGNSQMAKSMRRNTDAGHRGGAARSSVEASVMDVEQRSRIVTPAPLANLAREEPKIAGRLFDVSKQEVWEAFKKVKANRGSAGIDGKSIEDFEARVGDNLYKIWIRLRSGSYFPPAVKAVEIPKSRGGMRVLGIPTVADRVAQSVIKARLESVLDPIFDSDSYGFRPRKSAIQAIEVTRKRCWKFNWVVEFDIKGAFDNLDHSYLLMLLKRHTNCNWTLMYVERWLKSPLKLPDGSEARRNKGTPQGGVIGPLLMNLFMHYAFDIWIRKTFPDCRFARYADDAVVHCSNGTRAELVLRAISERLLKCKLEIHPSKSGIVYCKDSNRKLEHNRISFNFLGFGFRPRKVRWKDGSYGTSFGPAISVTALAKLRQRIRTWNIHRCTEFSLKEIARMINATVRGWYNYYGSFRRSELNQITNLLNRKLAHWSRRKYKSLARHKRKSAAFILQIQKSSPTLFAHWILNRNQTLVTMGAV